MWPRVAAIGLWGSSGQRIREPRKPRRFSAFEFSDTTRTEVDHLLAAVANASGDASQALLDALAKPQERLGALDGRLREIREQQAQLDSVQVDEEDLGRTLEQFDPIWDVLLTPEKERVLGLLIERIDYHGEDGTLSIAFRLPGIATLAAETALEADS